MGCISSRSFCLACERRAVLCAIEKQNIGVDVEKQPLEQLIADQHNLYIVTEAFAAENELPKGPLLVVEHLIATNKYEKLLRGDLSDVSNS